MAQNKIRFEFAHVGINPQSPEEDLRLRSFLSEVLGFRFREKPNSFFSTDNRMEMMKHAKGSCGHLGFFVEDMAAAVAWLEQQGWALDYENAHRGEDGSIRLIYLREELNGFRIHLAVKEPPYYVEE